MITWIRYKKPDVSMSLNGSLAGLVAITAGCDTVSPTSAAIIGIAAGFIVVFGIEFIDKVLKVDDPVGAVGVHGLNGAFGTLAVGLFSDGSGTDWKGLLVGGGFHGFGVQLAGMLITIAWVAVTMTIIFQVIKHTIGLRVSAEEEIQGLDIKEHGLASAYDGLLFAMLLLPFPLLWELPENLPLLPDLLLQLNSFRNSRQTAFISLQRLLSLPVRTSWKSLCRL